MGWKTAIRQTLKPTVVEFSRPKITTEKIDLNKVVTVDFETFFDVEYTLRKLSTSEYVRHEMFKTQMVGIKIGKRKTQVYSGAQAKRALQAIDWETHSLLCHNTAFDGFIMSHHYGVTPHRYYDTLSMARGLHSNEIGASLDDVAGYYGKGSKIEGVLEQTKGVRDWDKKLFSQMSVYCAQDVDLTFEIFQEMHKKYPVDELDLINLTIRMFCDPVLKVDIDRVAAEHEREVAKREQLFYAAVNPDDYDIGGKYHDLVFFKKSLLKTGAERQLQGSDRRMQIVKRLLGNNEFFAGLLRAEGIDPPIKVSKAWINASEEEREKKEQFAYAFAKDDLDFIGLPDNIDLWRGPLDPNKKKDLPRIVAKQDRLRDLIDARLAVKSTTNITRAARFLEAGKDGMSLPVGYAYYRAHTGRWGGNNKMNMQNLTRGGELRLSILAPYGYQVAVQDSGQIEARVNGWLWGQHDLMDAFRKADTWDKKKGVARGDDRDAYCRFGDQVYGREITTEDKMERFVGKVCVLGLGFQMGAPKFQMTLAKGALGGPPVYFELNECHRIVNAYRNMNYKIREGWAKCTQIIEDMAMGKSGTYKCLSWEKETLWLPNGMSLKYPQLRKQVNKEKGWDEWTYQSGDTRSKIYGGLLCENIVQALARIIVATQMLEINKKYRVVMTTHDEVVALPKTRDADKCIAYMAKCMSTAPTWCSDIPLNCEGGYADNYSK